MKKILTPLLALCLLAGASMAEDASFHRILVPDSKGRPVKAVLTFSDQHQAIEIQPVKGNPVSIPFAAIDKCVYEYTKKHHVSESTIATAPLGVGAVAMIRKSRAHWLRIDYHDNEIPRLYILRMDKRNYLRVLEAVKKYTGKDAEILGNANKRSR